VRAGPGVTSIGFLADIRRMNVALTRARSSLYVLGHAATLERSDVIWQRIVHDAKERDCFIDNVNKQTFEAPFRVAPQPVGPQKSRGPPPTLAPPVDALPLIKPQDIRRPNTVRSNLATSAGSTPGASSSAAPERVPEPEPQRWGKRPATVDDTPRPPPALRTEGSNSGNNPRLQPPTRPLPPARYALPPKPAPEASLFIPKPKALKRGPPTGNAGPSNAKRRLTDDLQRNRPP